MSKITTDEMLDEYLAMIKNKQLEEEVEELIDSIIDWSAKEPTKEKVDRVVKEIALKEQALQRVRPCPGAGMGYCARCARFDKSLSEIQTHEPSIHPVSWAEGCYFHIHIEKETPETKPEREYW